jgi:hypothetical protein
MLCRRNIYPLQLQWALVKRRQTSNTHEKKETECQPKQLGLRLRLSYATVWAWAVDWATDIRILDRISRKQKKEKLCISNGPMTTDLHSGDQRREQ